VPLDIFFEKFHVKWLSDSTFLFATESHIVQILQGSWTVLLRMTDFSNKDTSHKRFAVHSKESFW
jgi:hypothetical protein